MVRFTSASGRLVAVATCMALVRLVRRRKGCNVHLRTLAITEPRSSTTQLPALPKILLVGRVRMIIKSTLPQSRVHRTPAPRATHTVFTIRTSISLPSVPLSCPPLPFSYDTCRGPLLITTRPPPPRPSQTPGKPTRPHRLCMCLRLVLVHAHARADA